LTEWSAHQLCKLTGIPFSFMCRSSPDLTKAMFDEWIPTLKIGHVKLAVKTDGKSKELIR